VGGVWAKHRLYKGLKTNNTTGYYEFSDFPMDKSTYGVKTGGHIPGHVVNRYFEDYVEHFKLADKIRLNYKVDSAEHHVDGTWIVTATQRGKEAAVISSIATRKLIVATGLTSEPYMPKFDGQASFEASLLHCRYFLDYESDILQAGKRVTVFGGAKSAWDVAYACATSGVQVDWVIRASGHGPVWMTFPHATPFKICLEKLLMTRFLTWFSPCIWGDADGYGWVRTLLHGTWVGRQLIDTLHQMQNSHFIRLNGYDKHPQTQLLKPWHPSYHAASSVSILNYPTDFFEQVRNGNIRVHIADIVSLSSHTVHLSTGEALLTDALICSTGWRSTPPLKFLPESINTKLGLPWSPEILEKQLLEKATEEIKYRFPSLRSPPPASANYKLLSKDAEAAAPHPYRLTRFLVPPPLFNEHSIAFIGTTQTGCTALIAQTQALWVAAFFADQLASTPAATTDHLHSSVISERPDKSAPPASWDESSAMEWETALHTEFSKWRSPAGFGNRNPDFMIDALPYIDLLLKDLGLNSHRKKGPLREIFSPYTVKDYRGLIEEFKAARENR
jgi:hypothetical protein